MPPKIPFSGVIEYAIGLEGENWPKKVLSMLLEEHAARKEGKGYSHWPYEEMRKWVEETLMKGVRTDETVS